MHSQGARLAMVVTAAGRGVRFESDVPKQYFPLSGVPILQRTLTALDGCRQVDALVVVVESGQAERCREEIVAGRFGKVLAVVDGGSERSLSVREGLRELERWGRWELVAVHDGARPLVACADVERGVAVLLAEPELAGVVLAVPSVDTIKAVDSEGYITGTPDRKGLWHAQTPQIFRWHALMTAYSQPEQVLAVTTDDSALVALSGSKVKVVQGSIENLKITNRADLRYAESIVAERSS